MKCEVLYKRTTQGLHFEMHFYQIGKNKLLSIGKTLSIGQQKLSNIYIIIIPPPSTNKDWRLKMWGHELTWTIVSEVSGVIECPDSFISMSSSCSSCTSCPSPALFPEACCCLPCVARWLDNLYGSRRGCCCCRLQRHNSCSRLFESNHRYPHCSVCWSGSSSWHVLLSGSGHSFLHSSYPWLLASSMNISAKKQNSKDKQDDYRYFKWPHCSNVAFFKID